MTWAGIVGCQQNPKLPHSGLLKHYQCLVAPCHPVPFNPQMLCVEYHIENFGANWECGVEHSLPILYKLLNSLKVSAMMIYVKMDVWFTTVPWGAQGMGDTNQDGGLEVDGIQSWSIVLWIPLQYQANCKRWTPPQQPPQTQNALQCPWSAFLKTHDLVPRSSPGSLKFEKKLWLNN